jgi:hypothetical protein
MEKKRIILPTKNFAKAPDEELTLRVDFNSSSKILRENEKNVVLDVAELYNKERNNSIKYKIYGKIKMIFNNDYAGNTDYEYLKNNLYLVGDGSTNDYSGYIPYNEFAFLRNDILREINYPSIGDSIINFEQNIELTTEFTGHTTLTNSTAPYQNWNLYLSYVYTGLTDYSMTYTLSGDTSYNFLSGDGIPFILTNNGNFYTLTSPVEHGMNAGEYITLSGLSLDNSVSLLNKTFYINSVGNEIHNSEKYVINILKNQLKDKIVLTNNEVYIGKRCLDIKDITGTTSQYYVHKHKTLTTTDEYILDKLGFESSIWRDEKKMLFENFAGINDFVVEKNKMESVLYDFKSPFYLSGLTNNLGFTPTDIYVTVIFRNGNGYFDYPPKVGWKFNFHDSWVDNHFEKASSIENTITYKNFYKNQGTDIYTFKSGDTLNVNTELTGAFVEYNPKEMKERIISEAFHKFYTTTTIFDHNQDDQNYYSGVSANNVAGLFYQPHYRVKLRQLSPYIETSKTDDVVNIPENKKYFEDEKLWKWRDLYDHGYIDTDGFGTDYPFINGNHYIKLDINFYLRNEKNFINKKDGVKNFQFRIINC